jgi:tetratricopeptide (TPR) repeat protein
MSRRGSFALCLLFLGACQRTSSSSEQATPDAGPIVVVATRAVAEAPPFVAAPAPGPLAPCLARGVPPLEAARDYFDEGRFHEALSCAAQACAFEPDAAAPHALRGGALAALGRTAEAQLAYARALAVEPGNLEALLGAAHLYAVQLPSIREHDELGALYAERGLASCTASSPFLPRFAQVAAMAFNDLGQASEALVHATLVLKYEPGNREALYERALALFELCRFKEAKAAFSSLLDEPRRGAHAHHHLGLLLEREGRWKEARAHFAKARALSPEEFPELSLPSEEEFREEVARALEQLPEDMRRDLQDVPVRAEELPADEDLLSGEPPLSPAILGLFRGPPQGEPCDGMETPCRSVSLYRLNLARSVRSREQLREQIKLTLLHEGGHLRGEDDHELAARGLE